MTKEQIPEALPYIGAAVETLVDMVSPSLIYLYNRRVNSAGTTSAFKLCLVVDTDDKRDMEHHIYRRLDSDVPFDVLLYTPEEWERLADDNTSFAYKIKRTGTVLYG